VQYVLSRPHHRYPRAQLTDAIERAGLSVERSTYSNITFFLPTLIGRLIMRVTGLTPESEANINVSALNGILGWILGAESWWLKRMSFPFGVSIVCVARRD